MACHLLSTKPLPEPILTYCQSDPKEQTSVKTWSYLVQVMACCLYGTKPLPEPILTCQLYLNEQIFMKFEWKKKFHEENVFENVVCKMVTILFWPQCGAILAGMFIWNPVMYIACICIIYHPCLLIALYIDLHIMLKVCWVFRDIKRGLCMDLWNKHTWLNTPVYL